MAKEVKKLEIDDVLKVSRGNLQCYILGTTPLICNRMSEKAKHDLLLGGRRKTAIEKATTLKHDPHAEYRASVLGCACCRTALLGHLPHSFFRPAVSSFTNSCAP